MSLKPNQVPTQGLFTASSLLAPPSLQRAREFSAAQDFPSQPCGSLGGVAPAPWGLVSPSGRCTQLPGVSPPRPGMEMLQLAQTTSHRSVFPRALPPEFLEVLAKGSVPRGSYPGQGGGR